jgi:hypothetical protein
MVGRIVTATTCHSGRSELKDVALGGRSVGVETLLGRSKCGRFVMAPAILVVEATNLSVQPSCLNRQPSYL